MILSTRGATRRQHVLHGALALAAALGAGVACGAADSISPPDKVPCNTIYFGGGLVPFPPDGVSLCPAKTCNYQSQEGCAAGETCAPHVDLATSAVKPACRAAGQRARGEPCNGSSTSASEQCGVGLLCAEGACRTLCCGRDWSACDPGESCIRQAEVSIQGEVTPALAHLCFPVGTCSVLDPKACADQGRVCRIADPIGRTACMPAGDLVAGGTCNETHQCGPMLHCVKSSETATSGLCQKLCPWGVCADKTCGDSLCVRFNRDPPGVGECTENWHGPPFLIDGGVVSDAAGPFGP